MSDESQIPESDAPASDSSAAENPAADHGPTAPRDPGSSAADEKPDVLRCKCGTPVVPGAKNCSRCGCFTIANTAAETHKLVTAERRGVPAEIKESARLFYEQGVRDLGGLENLSRIEIGQLQNLTRVHTKIEMLDNYLTDAGPLTARGRLRTCVGAFFAAVGMYNTLAKQLGMSRRTKPAKLTIDDVMARIEREEAAEESARAANGEPDAPVTV